MFNQQSLASEFVFAQEAEFTSYNSACCEEGGGDPYMNNEPLIENIYIILLNNMNISSAETIMTSNHEI